MQQTEGCSEFRMRSRTSREVPKWSVGKELYIGSVVSAIGNDLGVAGIVPGPPDGCRGSTGWGHPSRRAPWAEVGREPAHSGLVHPPPWASLLRLGLETLGQGAPHMAWGASLPPWPPPPWRWISRAGAPLGGLYKGGGRAAAPYNLGASLSPLHLSLFP